jgi:ATP-dependent Clp protease ATP-binding subunit ClpA
VFERFTPGARRATVTSQEEARARGSRQIEPAHILLAVLRDPEDAGVAASIGTLVDVVPSLYAEVDAVVPRAADEYRSDLPFSGDAKEVLGRSAVLAQDLGDAHIGTEHLLLAVVDGDQGGIVEVLEHHGAGRDELLAALRSGRGAPGFQVRTTRGLGRFRKGGKAPG